MSEQTHYCDVCGGELGTNMVDEGYVHVNDEDDSHTPVLNEMPELERVDIRTDPDDGHLSVWPVWRGVDRPDSSGMAVKDRKTADRLVAAIKAGKAITAVGPSTDVKGNTYMITRWHVLSRMLNADLRRLGF